MHSHLCCLMHWKWVQSDQQKDPDKLKTGTQIFNIAYRRYITQICHNILHITKINTGIQNLKEVPLKPRI